VYILGGASNNTIGGTATGATNVISGNTNYGVGITDAGTTGNLVAGNLIGTNAAGSAPLGNYYGVYIQVGASSNTIGGTTTTARNIISGNQTGGILVTGSGTTGNLIEGNFIGIDPTGTAALANAFYDVLIQGGATANTVGGITSTPGTGAGNVISGNKTPSTTSGFGVEISGTGTANNVVEGNLIGTNAAGTAVLSNLDGVRIDTNASNNTIGGTAAGAGNVISGNTGNGVYILGSGTGNIVLGNSIGTDATGTAALGNGTGVLVANGATGNTIGGAAAGAGNLIAHNKGAGVAVGSSATDSSVNNAILSNTIFSNGRLGIDLGSDGVTLNTPGGPHTGPNLLQNFPAITSANVSGGSTTIMGTLNGAPSMTFTIQFFASAAPDPTGYGQGQQFLGQVAATTNSSGNATFSATLTISSLVGQFCTATATDLAGNTSEFSQAFATTMITLTSAPNPSTYGQSVTFTATVATVGSGTGTPTGTVIFMDGSNTLGTGTLTNGTATFSTAALAAGNHPIAAVYSGDTTNQGGTAALPGGQAVNKAHLTVTADPQSRLYGQSNPTFTATISGFVNGETLATSGVTGSASLSTNATPTSPVSGSPYAITTAIGTLAASNYDFPTLVNGTLSVTPAPVTPRITAASKTYDGTTVATLTSQVPLGVLASDTGNVSLTVNAANFDTPNAGTGKTVTATGLGLNGSAAANYTLGTMTSATATADITPASVTPQITAASKTYDGTTAATLTSQVPLGVLASDATTVSLNVAAANFDTPNAGTGKTVTATGLGLNGSAAANYTLGTTTSATASADITPASVTPQITAASKTYDGTTAATLTSQTLTGVLAADTGNVSLTVNAANFDTPNAETGKTVTATGLGLNGSAAANYTLGTTTSATATADVDPIVATRFVVTTTPPASIAVGAPFNVTVAAEDDAGRVATTFNRPVTVVLASDPTGATLDGTLTAPASNGVATFSGLALDKAGSGYTLQFSGGGLTVTSDPITTTGQVTAAAHQFLSTAQKQAFLDLAMAYAQRAARLTALATVTPAPLDVPLNELAAYYWDESLTYRAIANDPSDTDFTTVAPLQLASLPPLSPGGGITQAEADTFNALFAEQAQALGLAQAMSTALDRAQAAATDPANAADEQMQLAAVMMFSQELGPVAAREPGLLANVQTTLQAAGVADVSVSASDVQVLQDSAASGLPAGLASALQQLTNNDSQLQSIQAQDIQTAFRAQDAAATAGSLAATLTDPVFATQIQTAAQALTATVVLSGNLSPGSDSGVSHVDAITNDATPTFVGTAPPGTIVQLFAQSRVSSTPMLIGTGVADASGNWQITAAHLGDNTYAISTRFTEGDSGSVQVTPLTQVVIETVAPRIMAVSYNHNTGKMTITFDDSSGIDPKSLANPAFFVARNGKTARSPLLKISAFQRAGTQVTFTVSKGRAHPASVYLEVLAGGVQDVAGNALDGEYTGTFPTGDGHPGGNFSHVVPIATPKAPKPRKTFHRSKA
jgi:hypothetical protein